jgi:ubiquinone/menaquinone biosynthesis C-methylase UbiE
MGIEEEIVGMYNQLPFPDYGDNPLDDEYVSQKQFIDLILGFNGHGYSVYKDKSVLDAGCGTGRESMYLALQGAKVTAIDIADSSLKVANEQARKHEFRYDISFMKSSVLDMPFEDNQFDIVLSSGVIHHTLYPEKAFSELVRVLKPNGYIILFVYNNFAHMIPNLRRGIVNIFAGEDIHKRVDLAKKLFPGYLKRCNAARIYDEFAHPHKSEHSIAEVLSWFYRFGIRYLSVYPKFVFQGFYYTRKGNTIYKQTGRFIRIDDKFSNPNLLNRLSSGLLQLLRGYRAYSGGYRFLGTKKDGALRS